MTVTAVSPLVQNYPYVTAIQRRPQNLPDTLDSRKAREESGRLDASDQKNAVAAPSEDRGRRIDVYA